MVPTTDPDKVVTVSRVAHGTVQSSVWPWRSVTVPRSLCSPDPPTVMVVGIRVFWFPGSPMKRSGCPASGPIRLLMPAKAIVRPTTRTRSLAVGRVTASAVKKSPPRR